MNRDTFFFRTLSGSHWHRLWGICQCCFAAKKIWKQIFRDESDMKRYRLRKYVWPSSSQNVFFVKGFFIRVRFTGDPCGELLNYIFPSKRCEYNIENIWKGYGVNAIFYFEYFEIHHRYRWSDRLLDTIDHPIFYIHNSSKPGMYWNLAIFICQKCSNFWSSDPFCSRSD